MKTVDLVVNKDERPEDIRPHLLGLIRCIQKEGIPIIINVGDMRNIGKTTGLFVIANEYNGIILVNNQILAKELNEKFKTDLFFDYKNEKDYINIEKDVYVDEDVPIDTLDERVMKKFICGIVSNTEPTNETSFRDDIIKSLKENAKNLSKQIEIKTNKEDIGTVKNLIQALGSTLRLIDEYDYKLTYSEYKTNSGDKMIKQVAVWKQNNDGVIKNHKIWNVSE